MFSRILATLAGLAATAILVVAFWPQLIGYQRVWPFAVTVGMRGLTSMLAVMVIFLLLVIGRVGRWLQRTTGTLSILLLVFVVANTWLLITRGFDNNELIETHSDDITVLSWNTMGGSPAPLAIADLALSSDADIISLPETNQQTATSVLSILDSSGKSMTLLTNAFDDVYAAHSTTLLISKDLGEYELKTTGGDTSTAPTLIAVPVSGVGPTIVAAHASAPGPGTMENWRKDVSWLAEVCSGADVIMAGDLNGSIDNFTGLGPAALGKCADSAQVMNAAAIGTWPSWVPSFVGAPIDHIMYSGPYLATEFRVFDNPAGSKADHRPIVARLTTQ